LPFGAEHGRERSAIALANDDDGLALAVLVAGETAIAAVPNMVRWLDVTAEIATVDFRNNALAPSLRPFISSAMASRSL
jgi:hypothetical protein